MASAEKHADARPIPRSLVFLRHPARGGPTARLVGNRPPREFREAAGVDHEDEAGTTYRDFRKLPGMAGTIRRGSGRVFPFSENVLRDRMADLQRETQCPHDQTWREAFLCATGSQCMATSTNFAASWAMTTRRRPSGTTPKLRPRGKPKVLGHHAENGKLPKVLRFRKGQREKSEF